MNTGAGSLTEIGSACAEQRGRVARLHHFHQLLPRRAARAPRGDDPEAPGAPLPRRAPSFKQSLGFTGIILVFGVFLILFGVVWYGGMEKWYAKPLLILWPQHPSQLVQLARRPAGRSHTRTVAVPLGVRI